MSSGPLTRRELVVAGAVGSAAVAGWGAVPGWARKRPPALARGGKFVQGVASGVPGANRISLWTRISDVEGPARMQLEIARDPGFRRLVDRRRVIARPEDDFCVSPRVFARGLRAGERYWYRFETATEHSPVGSFRALPPAGSTDPVRIGFWNCQHFTAGHYAAHAGLAAEPDLDLVVCLGDYIYEYGGKSQVGGRDDLTGSNRDGNASALADYRAKYRLYRTDPMLRELQRSHATAFMWDDHEVANDYWRDGQSGAVVPGFAARRAAAYRAWHEHLPVPRLPGPGGTQTIYRRIHLGARADIFFTDCRQYRDAQPCGDAPLIPCPARSDPRTMLGARQKAWLKDGLGRSRAPWKVVVSGLMMMALDTPLPGFAKFGDTWDSYAAERKELVSFFRERALGEVIVMSGDDHDNYAGTLTTTGHTGGEPGAVEFVVPSVTSDNTSELLGGSALAAQVAEANARGLNPHLALVDQRRHGYCVLELRGDAATVEFRHVADRTDPRSPVATTYRLRVPHGRPVVERA
jgi:alkaline phosphatase D